MSAIRPPRVSRHFLVPLRYRKTCRAACRCTWPGLVGNCASLLVTKLMSGCVASATYCKKPVTLLVVVHIL